MHSSYSAKEAPSATNVDQKAAIDRVLPALFLWPGRLLFCCMQVCAEGLGRRSRSTSGTPGKACHERTTPCAAVKLVYPRSSRCAPRCAWPMPGTRAIGTRTAHEMAVKVAEEYSLLSLKAMSLRDLLTVRGGSKGTVEARLGKVLCAMDGPPDKLQRVLGDSVVVERIT